MPACGPVVLVANHSSLADGPLLLGMTKRRTVFLAKQELFRGPAGLLLPLIGQLSVRRGAPDRRPLLEAQRILRAGGLVAVFPEGTRGAGDAAAAHNGAAWLARSTGATVVPVACRGTRRPAGTSRRRYRPKVDVLLGEPFTVSAAPGRVGLATSTEQIRVALVALIAELDGLRATGTGRADSGELES